MLIVTILLIIKPYNTTIIYNHLYLQLDVSTSLLFYNNFIVCLSCHTQICVDRIFLAHPTKFYYYPELTIFSVVILRHGNLVTFGVYLVVLVGDKRMIWPEVVNPFLMAIFDSRRGKQSINGDWWWLALSLCCSKYPVLFRHINDPDLYCLCLCTM